MKIKFEITLIEVEDISYPNSSATIDIPLEIEVWNDTFLKFKWNDKTYLIRREDIASLHNANNFINIR